MRAKASHRAIQLDAKNKEGRNIAAVLSHVLAIERLLILRRFRVARTAPRSWPTRRLLFRLGFLAFASNYLEHAFRIDQQQFAVIGPIQIAPFKAGLVGLGRREALGWGKTFDAIRDPRIKRHLIVLQHGTAKRRRTLLVFARRRSGGGPPASETSDRAPCEP
jgi:hypothetical protein